MGLVYAEFLKLKRSLSWTVVIVLPIAMVIAGVVNTLAASRDLENGWHTIWLRSVVFYGLFPLAIGIGILSSLIWRVEHRGSNWNALMSGPTSSMRIIATKATVVAMLAAAMQLVLLVAVIAMGKFVFELPGMLPTRYFAISILIMLACVPVAVVQSGLSMLMRSFAAPIAVAFLGAGAAVVLLLAKIDAIVFVLPYALISRATQLGTGTFADTGSITSGDVAAVVVSVAILTAAAIIATTAIVNRQDTRV